MSIIEWAHDAQAVVTFIVFGKHIIKEIKATSGAVAAEKFLSEYQDEVDEVVQLPFE